MHNYTLYISKYVNKLLKVINKLSIVYLRNNPDSEHGLLQLFSFGNLLNEDTVRIPDAY